MTPQEIFDTVSAHLKGMSDRSMVVFEADCGVCAYRGDNGAQCAAGCLIPDELYNPDMEQHSFGLYFVEKFELPDWMAKNCGLIAMLQGVHDNRTHWGPDGLNEQGLARLAEIRSALAAAQ